jgi:hypothetical protein
MGISLRAVEKHLQRAYRFVLDFQLARDTENVKPQRHDSEERHDGNQ